MPLLDDLVLVLETDGVGIGGVTLFTSTKALLPTDGTAFLQLTETSGGPAENTHNCTLGPAILHPGAQLIAQATTKSVAEALAWQAWLSMFRIRNRFIGDNWYRSVRPLQAPGDLGPNAQGTLIKYGFNVLASYNRRGDTIVPAYSVIDVLGGDKFAFTTPSVADAYPAGSSITACVPDSWQLSLNGASLPSLVLEASARVESAGARAKVALVRLDTDAVIAELTFTADDTAGDVQRSAAFSLPSGVITYGIKQTTNSTSIGCAAWGARLLRAQ